jgi:nucleoside phosphorylase
MSLILVFTANSLEGAIVKRLMHNKTHTDGSKRKVSGRIGDNHIVLVTTGMGPRNAEAAASQVLRSAERSPKMFRDVAPAPDAALITGLAGSLVPWIAEGDLVIYENCLSDTDDQTSITCSPALVESMNRSLGSRGFLSKRVTAISSPRIAQRDQDRERLARSGAAVVDMESFQVATCSAAAGVPVAVIRAISDSPGARMPDLNRALTPDGYFDRWMLVGSLVSSPLATARLFRASRRGLAALEQALETVLSSASILAGPAHVEAPRDPNQSPESFGVLTGQHSKAPTRDSRVQK